MDFFFFNHFSPFCGKQRIKLFSTLPYVVSFSLRYQRLPDDHIRIKSANVPQSNPGVPELKTYLVLSPGTLRIYNLEV